MRWHSVLAPLTGCKKIYVGARHGGYRHYVALTAAIEPRTPDGVQRQNKCSFYVDFNILTALKGWVGLAPIGAGCPPYYYYLNLTLNLTLLRRAGIIFYIRDGIYTKLTLIG